ncbi:Stk1 family PASTA domain-containing Ser/Thr kinase [Alkalicoccus urumqiensis]|uniref:Serine/threonine-protein kinase PrkC n=1 Tax=Alkalicoccus urumqiensis TaxID=1548213 RepID=A0A2P6MG53_ALKUR|nr:Stk1 family PASTA domain-containing Ser/Thr kinase [Alkalicoccus urumqiensis]PRO65275.1 Stk1 family PASTA domain-containing Ser/Thr kinase [Alkalicoccus urumqiensis]
MIGKRINERYKIIRPVGGGGMADVFLAEDLILNRHVAVKVLKEQFSHDDEFIRRFHREAESAASLSHPNIVSLFDVGEENNVYYIVMQYVNGPTLKEYIKENGPLSSEESIRILKQIADALSHAHQNHLIHRDVKPQNILIGEDNNVLVTDFGIARAISDATITHTNSVLGSVHYLSPEQAKGGRITYQSDLYALGILLYEMLTGQVPFQGDTAVSVALKHLQDPMPDIRTHVPDLPQSVVDLISKLTAKSPDDRYASAESLSWDLETVLDPDRVIASTAPEDETGEETKIMPAVKPPETEATLSSEMKTPAQESPVSPKKKGRGKKAAGLLVLLVIFFIGMGIIALVFLPRLLHVEEVNVPEVSGQPVEEARMELEELDLEVEERTREDDDTEAGHVISTSPGAGTSVKVGSSIEVIVSSPDLPGEMPDVTGMTLEEAEEALEGLGDVETETVFTTEGTAGEIAEQQPEAGAAIEPPVNMLLSVSERETFTLNNFQGMTQEEVLEQSEDLPYVSFTFEEEPSSAEEGTAVSQFPERGTEISSPVEVTITLSSGTIEEEAEQPVPSEPEEDNEPGEAERSVPFRVEVPPGGGEYDIVISVEDAENSSPAVEISEVISETTEYDIPLIVEEGGSGFIHLEVDGETFADSPYEYTYDELVSGE